MRSLDRRAWGIEHIVKTEPKTSGVSIEEERQHKGKAEKDCVSRPVGNAKQERKGDIGAEDQEFRCNNVQITRSDEVSLFSQKDDIAVIASVSHLKK